MEWDSYWGADGDGTLAAERAGLSSASGLMIRSRKWGGDSYFFKADWKAGEEAEGTYFLWNMMTDDVYAYTNPTDLEGILERMRKPGGKVEMRLLQEQSGDSS